MKQPLFQIVRIDPVYCQFTDGILGSKATALPMTYLNFDYALKLAGFMERRDYECCGDSFYRVINLSQNREAHLCGFHYVHPTPEQIRQQFRPDYEEEFPF